MKVAIVHDQLQEFGGAERVLLALKQIYPEADVYTSAYNPKTLGVHAKEGAHWKIITAWTDKFFLTKKYYSPLRFITPLIWEPFDFSGYDLVISSSGTHMCKGIITKPKTLHICYLHHPPRYLYYYETAREWQKYWPIRIYGHLINHKLRLWDYLSSQRVDFFIANSIETKKRVEKFYRRDAHVIYPPVDIPEKITNYASPAGRQELRITNPYYVTTARLARAKHIDLLIEAAKQMKFHLKIIGTGRDEASLRNLAGNTVEFMGKVSDAKRNELLSQAKAFLFAAVDEEFGIAPVEAMGHSTPVIAYASGGLKETVTDGENGYFFPALSAASLIESIKKLEALDSEIYTKMRTTARHQAQQYSFARFKDQLTAFVQAKLL